MKKLFVIALVILFSASLAYGAVGAVKMSSNTVQANTTGRIVTFNTVINKILLINEDTTNTVHVSLNSLGWQSDGTYLLPTFQSNSTVGAFKLTPGSSVSVDITTNKIGLYTGGGAGANVNYLATSDTGTQP